MIDWKLALSTATKLSKPGPDLSAAEVAEAVAELREGAARSEGPVREFSDLHARSATAPVLVVDRPRWIEANLDTFKVMMDPVMAKLAASNKMPSGVGRVVGEKISGAELGALMSFMSTKVLGQFDPFWDGPNGEGGRLLLVAPNIVQAERQLDVDPHDFRLWVCLHEETHRVQFTAVDWMRAHMRSLLDEFVDATDLDSSALSSLVTDGLGEAIRIARGDSEASLADLFQNERQREIVDRLTGIMSLLEGHADVVMDGVGPEVIPTVAEIRRKFTQRRKGAGTFDRLLRRLLGLDAKMRQYRDGAEFVREVNAKVGLSGFNAVWAEPANLPTKSEILDPASWVTRVHG
ncbi:coenzyme F420 biosynthesis-associated protein [Aeromicrobium sp. Root236]|uniref:zinc-dependent metalloprotease n=1 Tax=Aeromicrobium sp. Root236 TaxID=1736498 RepID=UPI0006FBAFCF|nr:zinc-dependent metalloprotease [Aeromicrobium sp. Root236]KRC64991.1 coenzyme F420 biosynthesis-associated protein [Aeromicrobium sp. Root236]